MAHQENFPTSFRRKIERAGEVVKGWDKDGNKIFDNQEYTQSINELNRIQREHTQDPKIDVDCFKQVIRACKTTLSFKRVLFGGDFIKLARQFGNR